MPRSIAAVAAVSTPPIVDERKPDTGPSKDNALAIARQAPTMSRGAWLADVLKDRILNGFYQPGERIREGDLQQEFCFSNGPVREALQLVVAATLAERAPWQGVRVIALDRSEIGELFQLRTAMLEYIAERAARFAPPEVLDRGALLKANLVQAFAEATATGRNAVFGGELSSWLLDGAGNAMLRQMWDGITLRSRIYVNDALRKDGGAASLRHISALVDAVVAREPDAARRATRRLNRHLLRELEVETEL